MTHNEEGRTELSSLGQFALIDHLTEDFEWHNNSTIKGVGDDCAVIEKGDTLILVNSHTMVEGIHFDMSYTPLRHLGYKAVATALSNIAAMNGTPRQILVSIAVSNRYSVEALEELYSGIRLCCNRYDTDLVGGDTANARMGMTITVTAIGDTTRERITYRSGAKHYDLVCVSGDLGSAYGGLLILEREKVTFQANPNFQPELNGYEYVLERYLKPEPRFDIVKQLAEKGIRPTSMIDVSDGLASDMLHLCHGCGCGCEVYEERVPIDYQSSRVCNSMNKDLLPLNNALSGGEDYELLFTIDQSDHEKIQECQGIHIIGYITEKGAKPTLVTPQNTVIELTAPGFASNND